MLSKNKERVIVIFVLLVTVCFSLATTHAFAYDAWIPEDEGSDGKLMNLITRLSEMVTKANDSKAAHPDFINDLENLILEFQSYEHELSNTGPAYSSMPVEVEMQVRYLGRTADKVGSWDMTTPDGAPDEHMQVMIYFPTATNVESIRVWTSDNQGNKGSTWWWSDATGTSSPRRAWILGVYENERMLNPNMEDNLGLFEGWTLFDTYASIQGPSFERNECLFVQVTCSDGREYKEIFRSQGVQQPFSTP